MVGLAYLVESCTGKSVTLTRDGQICRAENRAMVDLLSANARKLRQPRSAFLIGVLYAVVIIGGFVDEAMRLLPHRLPRVVRLERVGKTTLTVEVDRAQLVQALVNLAINGAEAR